MPNRVCIVTAFGSNDSRTLAKQRLSLYILKLAAFTAEIPRENPALVISTDANWEYSGQQICPRARRQSFLSRDVAPAALLL